jgi:hypothetical protein
MRTLAEGVPGLAGRPPNAINVYLVADVLVEHGGAGGVPLDHVETIV